MAVAFGALAHVVGGCTNSPAVTAAGGAKIKGGTAAWALPPSSAPNYIFPFESSAYLSTYNNLSFAQFMYRPLYWFGAGAQALRRCQARHSAKKRRRPARGRRRGLSQRSPR
jgi:hypothetical protein